MSNNKRLFLFAGYSSDGVLDDALVFYVKKLAKCGDVILCMDSNCPDAELNKVSKYTIARIGTRHCEYDFGSYKRAYEYAKNNKLLNKYDFVYMVNDSVYGPLHDIGTVLQQMESKNTDAFGMVESRHTHYRHIQSWFIGMRKSVFLSTWFDEFIMSVKQLPHKYLITVLYENKFTDILEEHGGTWYCPFICRGRSVYNNPKRLFNLGCPFIKKMSFSRHNGAVGYQLNYVLNNCPTDARDAIVSAANHVYSPEYISWLLTSNPISKFTRGIKYIFQKARNKQ